MTNTAGDGNKPVIGVAWRPENGPEYRALWETILQRVGAQAAFLPQVVFAEDWYEPGNAAVAPPFLDGSGMLGAASARQLKAAGWTHSNAAQTLAGVDGVIFTGGGDISTTLCSPPAALESNEGFQPVRDISDDLLLRCCLDKDLPVLCICRSMQLLALVSGAALIQDLPQFCARTGRTNTDAHRMAAPAPERDYLLHDVDVAAGDSLLARIAAGGTLRGMPSWHHQAVGALGGAPLAVTGTTTTGDLTVIEAVERTDQTFALGVQFHPEIALRRKYLDGKADPGSDDAVCLRMFAALADAAGAHRSGGQDRK